MFKKLSILLAVAFAPCFADWEEEKKQIASILNDLAVTTHPEHRCLNLEQKKDELTKKTHALTEYQVLIVNENDREAAKAKTTEIANHLLNTFLSTDHVELYFQHTHSSSQKCLQIINQCDDNKAFWIIAMLLGQITTILSSDLYFKVATQALWNSEKEQEIALDKTPTTMQEQKAFILLEACATTIQVSQVTSMDNDSVEKCFTEAIRCFTQEEQLKILSYLNNPEVVKVVNAKATLYFVNPQFVNYVSAHTNLITALEEQIKNPS